MVGAVVGGSVGLLVVKVDVGATVVGGRVGATVVEMGGEYSVRARRKRHPHELSRGTQPEYQHQDWSCMFEG